MPVGRDVVDYELTVVYTPKIVAHLADAVRDTVDVAAFAGYKVCSMDVEGKKTLTYPVRDKYGKEQKKGIYTFFTLAGAGEASSLTSALEQDHRVLRYLLVRARKQVKRSINNVRSEN